MHTRAAILSSLITGSSIVVAAWILRPVRAEIEPSVPAEKPCPVTIAGSYETPEEYRAALERTRRQQERIRRERPDC